MLCIYICFIYIYIYTYVCIYIVSDAYAAVESVCNVCTHMSEVKGTYQYSEECCQNIVNISTV